jgi:3'(2'), 5'-bisphosphate nucleotidase
LETRERDTIAAHLAQIARDAGDILLAHRHAPHQVTWKADGSPVTLADEAAEAVILAALARDFPDIPVISEENAQSHGHAPQGRFFLVDPLDGTRGFLKGNPAFCVLIALVEDGVPVASALDAPAFDQLFWAGTHAFEANRRVMEAAVQLRPAQRKAEAEETIAIISSHHAKAISRTICQKMGATKVLDEPSAVKFARMARGEADVYPRFGQTMQWDVAAGDALLRAVGGGVFTANGQRITYGADAAAKGWTMPDFIALRHAGDVGKIMGA